MPAEIGPLGRQVDAERVIELLWALLSDDPGPAEELTLAQLGVGVNDLGDLWDAVREEFAPPTAGTEVGPSNLGPSMTLADAATAMASLLQGAGHERRPR